MVYIYGVEGGGTKTVGALSDSDGNIKVIKVGGPSNFLLIGVEEASKNIYDILIECMKDANIDSKDVIISMLGLTGAGRLDDQEKMKRGFQEYLRKNNFEFKKVIVNSDARISLEAAFPDSPGMILISGTGSIMFGKNSNNEIIRVGGWGRTIGDEGSGYSLGKNALNIVTRIIDGREKTNMLFDLISKKFQLNSLESIVNAVYKTNFDIASIAPVVFEAAEKRDRDAIKIVNKAVNDLFLHISTMVERINENDNIGLSLDGSLLTNETIIRKKLLAKIKKDLKKVYIKQKENDTIYGAIFMAMKELKNL